MRFIEYDCTDPYFNLAAEEYLFMRKDPETIFRLWQNDNTIVIGKNQNPYSEINIEFAREKQVNISRRMTGGGAVYHDLGNICFTFVADTDKNAYDFTKFTRPVIGALADMGIHAENQGRNDIAIQGRKISGNAQFVLGGRVLHHGTLLFDSDLDFIGSCLNVSEEKLKSNSVASVKSRVANISEYTKKSIQEFWSALRSYVMNEYGCESLSTFTDREIRDISKLRDEKYASSDWIYGASPDYDFSVSKRFEGCGNINFVANVKSGFFENCRIFGDFFGTGPVSDIEKLLNKIPHSPEAVERALENAEISYYFNNLTKNDFMSLFL